MARYATVSGGIVTNVIEADAQFAQQVGAYACAPEVSPGWLWDGTNFSAPPAPTPEVPKSVTMRQARRALHATGKLSQVQAAIDSLSEPTKTAAQIDWDYSNEVLRHFGLVTSLAQSLGWTDEELDALFILAASYTA